MAVEKLKKAGNTMMAPFFSIIVPMHNIDTYIYECLQSILNQNFYNFEIIAVDDASTDNTVKICRMLEIQTQRLRIIELSEQRGVSYARNVGLRAAEGTYILFCDGDDIWIDNYNILYQLFELISKNKPDIILSSMYYRLYKNGLKQETKHIVENELDYQEILKKVVSNEDWSWAIWKNIYRKKTIINNNIFFEEGITCSEDGIWLMRLLLNVTSVCFFSHPFYIYRVEREGSAMNTLPLKKWKDSLVISEKTIKDISLKNENALIKSIICRIINGCFNGLYEIKYFNKQEKEDAFIFLQNCSFWNYAYTKKQKLMMYFKKLFGAKATIYFLVFYLHIKHKFMDKEGI